MFAGSIEEVVCVGDASWGGFRNWKDFKQRLFVSFSESIEDEPSTRLFSIRQTGSVAEYV